MSTSISWARTAGPSSPSNDGSRTIAGASRDEILARLGPALGGSVADLRRLPGGASRATEALELRAGDGTIRELVLQRERRMDAGSDGDRARVEAALLRAATAAGVPVPKVVAAGTDDGLPPGWLVVEKVAGESIPRRILRDPEWERARVALAADCGRALAAIHRIDPSAVDGLPRHDPLEDPRSVLDAHGEARPALELGLRWLAAHRPPPQPTTTVHGDFRLGNLMVDAHGLAAVLDWELAHAGDAAEDIGWLCAPAWRFGGPGRVGGFGDLTTLLAAYTAAGGADLDAARVHWWEVFATVKWAVICILQAAAHLGGHARSLELAAVGRRVCESEWDLCVLLGWAPDTSTEPGPTSPRAAAPDALFGRPTLEELIEALGEHLARTEQLQSDPGARFDAHVATRVLGIVGRQVRLGPAVARAHRRRLHHLGAADDTALVAAIRQGAFDGAFVEVGRELAESARDQLLVANPSHLDRP